MSINLTITNTGKQTKHGHAHRWLHLDSKGGTQQFRIQNQKQNLCGFPVTNAHSIDTELVSNVIARLTRGKAADAVELSAEHLTHSHPSISVALAKLFRLIMLYRHVPTGFRYSYIVPIPKLKDCRTKSVSCDDFRGIAISPILSKVFEQCTLDRFGSLFVSCDAQFGFYHAMLAQSAVMRQ